MAVHIISSYYTHGLPHPLVAVVWLFLIVIFLATAYWVRHVLVKISVCLVAEAVPPALAGVLGVVSVVLVAAVELAFYHT